MKDRLRWHARWIVPVAVAFGGVAASYYGGAAGADLYRRVLETLAPAVTP